MRLEQLLSIPFLVRKTFPPDLDGLEFLVEQRANGQDVGHGRGPDFLKAISVSYLLRARDPNAFIRLMFFSDNFVNCTPEFLSAHIQ
jgi:hypothetical protein